MSPLEDRMQPVFEMVRMYTKEVSGLLVGRIFGVTSFELGVNFPPLRD